MWALLALLVCLPGALGVSRFHERNNTGLLWAFDMTAGQLSDSPPAFVPDFTGRGLLGNLTTATNGAIQWDPARQGFSVSGVAGGDRAVSQLTSAAVLPHLQDEFSIELFLSTPPYPLGDPVPIAGFGMGTSGLSCTNAAETKTVSPGGWQVTASVDGGLVFTVILERVGVPYCHGVGLVVDPDTPWHHLVVGIRNAPPGTPGIIDIRSHLASTAVFPSGISLNSSHWDAPAGSLVVGEPRTPRTWTGSLYWIAMYNRYLSDTEVATKRLQGPPNSFPYGVGGVTATEDAPLVLVSM